MIDMINNVNNNDITHYHKDNFIHFTNFTDELIKNNLASS